MKYYGVEVAEMKVGSLFRSCSLRSVGPCSGLPQGRAFPRSHEAWETSSAHFTIHTAKEHTKFFSFRDKSVSLAVKVFFESTYLHQLSFFLPSSFCGFQISFAVPSPAPDSYYGEACPGQADCY